MGIIYFYWTSKPTVMAEQVIVDGSVAAKEAGRLCMDTGKTQRQCNDYCEETYAIVGLVGYCDMGASDRNSELNAQ